MDWKQIAGNKWTPVFGAAFFIIGLPGTVEDFTAWKMWVSNMSPTWSGVLVGIGGTVIVLWLVVWLTDKKERRKEKNSTFKTVFFPLIWCIEKYRQFVAWATDEDQEESVQYLKLAILLSVSFALLMLGGLVVMTAAFGLLRGFFWVLAQFLCGFDPACVYDFMADI